ncbi:MAG TPA: SDR family NAD(P)-dependent oxidoreductase [Ferruginibacter sp.]|nr:SDR family NAD(P)-dependent oxidoreductase [Ferruginibacter sp.]
MNKAAIITGASGNMGQAVVQKFVAEGYQVIGTVTQQDAALSRFGAAVEQVVVDLSDEPAAAAFVEKAIAKQYTLNFETAYNVARPCFVQMMKQGAGRIFLVGSRPGLNARDGKGMVAYGLAKSLIFRLAELMNAEAKGSNVVTSVVVPSTIDTPQNRSAMPDASFDTWVKPEAIAELIHFHCTDAAATLREPVIKVYNNA